MKIAQLIDGALAFAEREFEVVEQAAEADLAAAKALLMPDIEAAAAHLAAVLKADGLAMVEQAATVALTTPGTPAEKADTAIKVALVGLQAMGKDTQQVGVEFLQQAIATVQAKVGTPAQQPAQ